MTPAEEFRAARATLGMTQQQLGDALGFRRGKVTVCEIERGKKNPRETVVRYLRTLVAAGARPTSKLG